MDDSITMAEYLLLRLKQLGVKSVHGVPGDYTLTILDHLKPMGLRWVGNANELNAGYAADGYARINGISAIITSFGVGELSAINAIAGAFAEKVPVVHIVGTATVAAQDAGACIHHSLGTGNLRIFADMYRSVTVAQANLVDAAQAAELIDSTLKQCVLQSRPVYIEVPLDMVHVKVPAPTAPIDLNISERSIVLEGQLANRIIERMQRARRPLILVDGFSSRYGFRDSINELVRSTGFATLTTPFGKGVVDETLPNFHGIFFGSVGDPFHVEWVKNCDLVLYFCPLRSDINTFGFTALPTDEATIIFENDCVSFGNALEYRDVHYGVGVGSLLKDIVSHVPDLDLVKPESFPEDSLAPRQLLKDLPELDESATIDQYSFWLRISGFFRSGDVVMTEAGTSSYGAQSMILPQNTRLICSAIWLSIGYMLAAAQGVSLANRDAAGDGQSSRGRTILFEGDGSLQMSAQAISDIIRNKLDVTIFVINNDGYTVERIIHGFYEDYNDIQPWRNLEAPSYFGAPRDDPSYPVRTRSVKTWGELQAVMNDPEIQEGKGLNMIEVFMSIDDVPASLQKFVEWVKARAKQPTDLK